MTAYHAFVHKQTGRRFRPDFENISSYHELMDMGLPEESLFVFPMGDQSKQFKQLDGDDAYKKLTVFRT